MFEAYKEDVLAEVICVSSYATTVRRRAIDFAGKIVKTGHRIIFKVSLAIMKSLNLRRLWELCNNPIIIAQKT